MRNRMLAAVARTTDKKFNILQGGLALPVTFFLMILGGTIGEIVVGGLFFFLPTTWIQGLFFLIDPMFLTLFSFVFTALAVFIWVKFVQKRSLIGLGLFREGALRESLLGFGLGALMMTMVVALLLVTGSMELTGFYFTLPNLLNLVLILPFWWIQSGTEELLTRGFLFPVVARNTRVWIGTACSSLLFALLHVGNPSVSWIALLNIALFGCLACLYVLKTDNIWGVAALHAAWNYFQGSFYGLPVSGLMTAYAPMTFHIKDGSPQEISGGFFGPEGSLLSSLVMLLVIGWLLWELKKKKQNSAA